MADPLTDEQAPRPPVTDDFPTVEQVRTAEEWVRETPVHEAHHDWMIVRAEHMRAIMAHKDSLRVALEKIERTLRPIHKYDETTQDEAWAAYETAKEALG